jgi:class 3 adenylate cyclase
VEQIPERETRYVKTADGYVGYQVFGSGPIDLLFISAWSSNLDVMWQEPTLARYLDRLASFARVICFDKRGSGVSDPVPLASIPSLDAWMDDARSVMDAVGSKRAAVLGDAEGGPMAILFAATFPDRVSSLVLTNTFARFRRADDYPIGMPDHAYERMLESANSYFGRSFEIALLTAPSAALDPRFQRWLPMYQRVSMPPGTFEAMYRWVTSLDVRSVLPAVTAPTLVITRTDALHHRPTFGRYLAENIPDATLVELPGADTYPFHAGDFAPLVDEIERFFTGHDKAPESNRLLATCLFTDIVGSTQRAAEVGDERWLDLLSVHDRVSGEHVERYRGELVKHTGDGILATFDGPARAVTCGIRLTDELQRSGIEIRTGLHTGEIEHRGNEVAGIAVHIAQRVMDHAPDSGVAVSATVKDLVTGSGFSFEPLGSHELKGVPGEWALHRVTEQR